MKSWRVGGRGPCRYLGIDLTLSISECSRTARGPGLQLAQSKTKQRGWRDDVTELSRHSLGLGFFSECSRRLLAGAECRADVVTVRMDPGWSRRTTVEARTPPPPTSYTQWPGGLTVLIAAARVLVAMGTLHLVTGTAALTRVCTVQLWACVSSRFPAWCLNVLSIPGNISTSKVIRMGVNGGLHAFPSVGQHCGIVHVPRIVNEESLCPCPASTQSEKEK